MMNHKKRALLEPDLKMVLIHQKQSKEYFWMGSQEFVLKMAKKFKMAATAILKMKCFILGLVFQVKRQMKYHFPLNQAWGIHWKCQFKCWGPFRTKNSRWLPPPY